MNILKLQASILFVLTVFLATSCKKEKTDDAATTSTTEQIANATDNTMASTDYEDAVSEADEAIGANTKSALETQAGETKLNTKFSRPKKGMLKCEITFDGTTRRGKVKSGNIIVTITKPEQGDTTNETLWIKTITFENYTVNSRKIEGTKTIAYKGLVNGKPEWSIKLENGKVTFKNGKTITMAFTRTRTMIAGYTTRPDRTDDVFELNGTGNGANRKGETYTSTITALVKTTVCPNFKSGTVKYESNKKTVTITYNGGEACSANVTVDVDGKIQTVDTETEKN